MVNSIEETCRPVCQCTLREIWAWQQDTMNPIIPTTLIEIGWPQVNGGCPYKVLNSQWVPTKPEARWYECVNITEVREVHQISMKQTLVFRIWLVRQCNPVWMHKLTDIITSLCSVLVTCTSRVKIGINWIVPV